MALVDQTCPAQGVMEEQFKVAEAMLTQTGLHLPKDIPDIMSFIKIQGANTECESIDVHWVSWPGKELLTRQEAFRVHSPQSFTLKSRRAVLPSCDPKSYRAFASDFPIAEIIVFGTTEKDEIRGLHVMRDPRSIIAECPELWGGKSTPETRCGEFIRPEAIVSVAMPRDPALARLVFFARIFTGPGQWHLERLGILDLAQVKP
jgi:hypothetical protein